MARLVLCQILVVWAANQAPPYDQAWCWEGKICTANSQCKQPNGVGGACCNGVCRNFKLSRGELCGSSLTDSGCPSCGANLKCADSGAGKFLCEQENAANGCLCNSTSGNCLSSQPCLPSGYCGPASVLPGGSCEVASQCYPNSDCNVTCQPIPNGQGCVPDTSFNLCMSGSICFSNSKCATISQLGDPCNADYECAQPGLFCSNKNCANRTQVGGNCTGTACVVGALCNSGACVMPRSLAANAPCTNATACASGYCKGGTCADTHFRMAGQSCSAHLDCPFGASCLNQVCTPSGLNAPCDPTLGGGDMDKQCQGSLDLYCTCAGLCVPTDAAILPTGPLASDCETAKEIVSKMNLKDITKLDVNSFTAPQRNALATFQCCKNCNKGMRVSSLGFSVDCVAKTISPASLNCGVYSVDPLALKGCPVATSAALQLGPALLLLAAGLFN